MSQTKNRDQWEERPFFHNRMHIDVQQRCSRNIHTEDRALDFLVYGGQPVIQIHLIPYKFPIACAIDAVLHTNDIIVETKMLLPKNDGRKSAQRI